MSKTCPYPFRYNADYRKAEAERPYKEDSDSEDDDKNSTGPPTEESDEDDILYLDADQDR